MSTQVPQPLRVAMLARVVFPLHGFGGIERHVFHLVTHLARLGVRVTLYVQPATTDDRRLTTDELERKMQVVSGQLSVVNVKGGGAFRRRVLQPRRRRFGSCGRTTSSTAEER